MSRKLIPKSSFRKEVEKRLIDLDMTKQELARKMGISDAYIVDLLDGGRRSPERLSQIREIIGLESPESQRDAEQ